MEFFFCYWAKDSQIGPIVANIRKQIFLDFLFHLCLLLEILFLFWKSVVLAQGVALEMDGCDLSNLEKKLLFFFVLIYLYAFADNCSI